MPEFLNPNNYAVHLPGPDGVVTKVRGRTRVVLPEFYKRYESRGFLKEVKLGQPHVPLPPAATRQIQAKVINSGRKKPAAPAVNREKVKRPEIARARKIAAINRREPTPAQPQQRMRERQIVGRAVNGNPNEILRTNLAAGNYPVSDNIGVGILSFNRAASLRRLIDSILRHTDLRRTTVFVSDDASTDAATTAYLDELGRNPNFVVLRNNHRLGIAGNSNRLLRCLSRFKYGLLLNDDVEVLREGWERFYPQAMEKSGLHHLAYRQNGVYGAVRGEAVQVGGLNCVRVMEKPHGAVLAFDHAVLQTAGYFDESYGLYGMEHVDWSQRVWEVGMQEPGFFDAVGSDESFRLHPDNSAVADRSKLLTVARRVFGERCPKKVDPTDASRVPEVAYVIPFRDFERSDSILTVVNNVRAQRFPVVHLVLVEQDQVSRIDQERYRPITHTMAPAANQLFNKSMAFNRGVSLAPCPMVILHDADMLAPGHYTSDVAAVLAKHAACHVGGTVLYTVKEAMEAINRTGIIDSTVNCDRMVGYYEGGSLACTKRAYWGVGGFNEDYWGYGCEDCDFFARLSEGTPTWHEDRSFDFLHLWHSRATGWHGHHETNRHLEATLKRLPMAERIQLQLDQLRRLGYGREVTEALS